jgi:4-hydroxy-tetrahydrodipicolinate reductase
MPPTKIAVHGAAGRMGQRVVALGIADDQIEVAAALEGRGHPQLGTDAGLVAGAGELGVLLSASLETNVDAVIDFSVPDAIGAITATCIAAGVPLVVATTGLSDAGQANLREAANKIAIVWSPNMSLAVNLTMKLAEVAGQALKNHPSGADVEILERHHRYKEDAPSGTALQFGKVISDVMGQTSETHGRQGRPGKRPPGEIAYHAIRVGDNPGEHTIVFGLLGETIELRVAATNRDCYAHGALAAAKFIAGKPPGMYSMNDVLF